MQEFGETKPRILALIGARGGSKGLPNKNILDFGGKPLIQWTIEAALESKYVTDVVVSTDSERIQTVAVAAGARAPFLRPAHLAEDHSDQNDAIVHAIEWLKEQQAREYDYLVLLQPTQPLRPKGYVDELIEYYFRNRTIAEATLVTVVPAPDKCAYLMKVENEKYIRFAFQDQLSSNRQLAPKYYLPAGMFYMAAINDFVDRKSFYGANTLFYETSSEFSIDIDTEADFENALEIHSRSNIR